MAPHSTVEAVLLVLDELERLLADLRQYMASERTEADAQTKEVQQGD